MSEVRTSAGVTASSEPQRASLRAPNISWLQAFRSPIGNPQIYFLFFHLIKRNKIDHATTVRLDIGMLTHIHRNCNALAQPCISNSASADVHTCHPVFCAQLRLHADCNSVLSVRLPSPRVARNENDADLECLEPAARISPANVLASTIATRWMRKLATPGISC